MKASPADLSALLGSRICHDLISPLGAIGNGIELLQLSGIEGPEVALIAEAVKDANLRIRFFRVAFGTAREGQIMAESEVRNILAPDTGGRRVAIDWQASGDLPRREVKLAFLALLCLESALPYGGQINVLCRDSDWHVTGIGKRLKVDADLWEILEQAVPEALPAPAQLHFALMGQELILQGRKAQTDIVPEQISLTF